jgi:hypothetical protein
MLHITPLSSNGNIAGSVCDAATHSGFDNFQTSGLFQSVVPVLFGEIYRTQE